MPERPDIPEELQPADAVEATPCAPAGERVEIATAEDVARIHANAKEKTPVLDVHMPHATHTWRDFFIHLGTITAGLLIAISLEQSVEKLHHLHQRHELEASLRAEAATNKERAEVDFVRYDDEMTWLLGLHEDIGRMLAMGGKANLPYRTVHETPLVIDGNPYHGRPMALLTTVWDMAAADSRLSLLPDEVANGDSLLYHVRGERFALLRTLAGNAMDQQQAFEARFADISTPTTPVLARMSADDLKQYDTLTMQSFTAIRVAKAALRLVYVSNERMLLGIYDSASASPIYEEEQTRFADDFGKMARQTAAEDAARDGAAARPVEKNKP
jgi:hypothetical protein